VSFAGFISVFHPLLRPTARGALAHFLAEAHPFLPGWFSVNVRRPDGRNRKRRHFWSNAACRCNVLFELAVPVSAGLFLLRALGRASARLGGTAERRVIAAGIATVLEFGDVALAVANDSQGRFAAGARMSTDELGRL